jgi:hypothetical protein
MGFASEYSEDEWVKYDRAERQYLRALRDEHPEGVYLQRREILPFERMILKMGGSVVLQEALGKRIDTNKVQHVY